MARFAGLSPYRGRGSRACHRTDLRLEHATQVALPARGCGSRKLLVTPGQKKTVHLVRKGNGSHWSQCFGLIGSELEDHSPYNVTQVAPSIRL